MTEVVIRDPKGKPVLAKKIRDLFLTEKRIPFFLVETGVWFTVTEPRSGTLIGSSAVSEDAAIDEAVTELSRHSHESFLGGVKRIVDTYGTLPSVNELKKQARG